MTTTPEIEEEVLRIFRQNPKRFSPFKASKTVGCALADVIEIVNKNKHTLSDGTEHSGGRGREDLQPYIIASRRANDGGWNNDEPAIVAARKCYEDGSHTMATHRDGAWLFLCLFPLRWPSTPRKGYFQAGAA